MVSMPQIPHFLQHPDPITGLAYFIPSIVNSYGYSPIRSQLYSVAPWGAAVVFSLLLAYLSDLARKRFPFVIACLVVAFIGNIILFVVHDNRHVEYAAVFLFLMSVTSSLPLIVCWFAMNLDGHAERAVGIPWQIAFGNLGGLISTFTFPSSQAPIYRLGYSLGLASLCIVTLASTVYFLGCWLENRNRPRDKRLML